MSAKIGIREYNYHTWARFMVREPKDRPKGPHFGAVLFGSRDDHVPGYEAGDSGYTTSVPEVLYFAFQDRSDLETWVASATHDKKQFFCFYVPKLAEPEVRVSVGLDVTIEDAVMPDGVARIRAVVGFAFSYDLSSVLLIRKQKPASQAGKLNGVGGKLELGEEPIHAMVREFHEESGIVTVASDWEMFAVMDSSRWEVSFFRATVSCGALLAAAVGPQLTHERVECWDVVELVNQSTMRNLRWLIPFCLDTSPYELPLRFREVE